jgi:molecular chaperone GrpE
MSKHSFHHEHHRADRHENHREKHKDPVKNGESACGPEDAEGRGPESCDAASGAVRDESLNAAGKAGGTERGKIPAGGPEALEDGEALDAQEALEENEENAEVSGPGNKAAGNGAGAEGRIAELEAQAADYKDQLLRKQAEFENFRKRMNREKLEAIDFANQSLLLDLIPILDDFDRAMQSAGSSRDFTALYEGVGMIAKRLTGTLDAKWGLKGYVSAGTPFDPNFHEALMMEKSSAVAEQTVQMDLLKGYTLKNRVIRSNKVKVLDPDPAAPAIEAPPAPQKEGDPAETAGKAAPESPAGEDAGDGA